MKIETQSDNNLLKVFIISTVIAIISMGTLGEYFKYKRYIEEQKIRYHAVEFAVTQASYAKVNETINEIQAKIDSARNSNK